MIENLDNTIVEVKKYFNKIIKIVNEEASFTLLTTKIINKNKIDDVLCCIEAVFPKDYKGLLKINKEVKIGNYKLKSINLYFAVKACIQRKFIFSSNMYSVNYKLIQGAVNKFLFAFEQDIKFMNKNL